MIASLLQLVADQQQKSPATHPVIDRQMLVIVVIAVMGSLLLLSIVAVLAPKPPRQTPPEWPLRWDDDTTAVLKHRAVHRRDVQARR